MTKPNVQEVVDAVLEWHNATRNSLAGPPGSWDNKLRAVRENFRQRMRELGLEDALDWSDPGYK